MAPTLSYTAPQKRPATLTHLFSTICGYFFTDLLQVSCKIGFYVKPSTWHQYKL